MKQLIYDDLSSWYSLLDPLEDHDDEGAFFLSTLSEALGESKPARPTLLELGAGAGNNAYYMKAEFDCVLTDLSPAMIALSESVNPECEHAQGDMRTLRLGRQFDAVVIHDAIVYMTNETELAQALATAFVHTKPGGVAIFAPDCTRETFVEGVDDHGNDADDGRRLRCFEWMRDPDPTDTTYVVDYAFFLEENGEVRASHDQHIEGLFSEDTWLRLVQGAGYEVMHVKREIDVEGEHPFVEHVFLARRPD